MDKDKINSKIEDLEAELQKLKKLANEPEKREPEAGGVWQGFSGSDWLVGESRATIEPHRGKPNEPAYLADIAKRCAEIDAEGIHHFGYHMHSRRNPCRATHLCKFNEVYVKIADVRAALSHKDVDGEAMLDYFNQEFKSEVQNYGAGESFKALRKLNIITD